MGKGGRIITLCQQRVIKPEEVHPVLIEDGDRLILVDCGDPELAGALCGEMRRYGIDPKNITDIIVTHHDLDHMGGLSQFRDMLPDVNVMATGYQAEFISGRRRWLRLQEEDRQYLSQPPEERVPSGRVRAAQYLWFLPARVDTFIKPGDELPVCGGCTVLDTPWHMPGHISLYLPEARALITGDALNTFGGMLGLNSKVDLCPEKTAEGLRTLEALDVETVYGYHGGELKLLPGEFTESIMRLRAAAEGLKSRTCSYFH